MTIWNVVILTAVLQGFLLALFLVANKKGNRTANVFLAFLVALYSLDIGLETLYASPRVFAYPHLIGINDPLFFLYGPLLYCYAYFLSSPPAVSSKKWLIHFPLRNNAGGGLDTLTNVRVSASDAPPQGRNAHVSKRVHKARFLSENGIIHFLPFLFVVAFYTPALYLQSVEVKLLSEGIQPPPTTFAANPLINESLRGFAALASGFHQLLYFVLTLRLLRRHENIIKDSFSAVERINLTWLRNLTFATGVIVAVDIVLYFGVKLEILRFDKAVTVILLLVAALIYAIGYMGLRQPAIFSAEMFASPAETEAVNAISAVEKREKYYKSTLTEPQAAANLASLLALMESEKLYLDGELKLSDVAETLGLSNNNLSQIINDKLQKNFYDFVNAYRVETAKKLLLNPKKDHLTLLAVAFEAGFNSKSSFNSVFKKQCQMTPSEYKKARLN